jgi:hypothetical protein
MSPTYGFNEMGTLFKLLVVFRLSTYIILINELSPDPHSSSEGNDPTTFTIIWNFLVPLNTFRDLGIYAKRASTSSPNLVNKAFCALHFSQTRESLIRFIIEVDLTTYSHC